MNKGRNAFEKTLFCLFIGMLGVGAIAACVAVVAAVGLPIRQISHHVDVSICRTYAQQSGYETRFVEYNWFNWECLVKADNGKWVNKNNIHDVNIEPR